MTLVVVFSSKVVPVFAIIPIFPWYRIRFAGSMGKSLGKTNVNWQFVFSGTGDRNCTSIVVSSPTVFYIDPPTIDCEIPALVSVAGVVTVRVAELDESI